MEFCSLLSVICIYCALVCSVSGQQTGAIPEEDKKSSKEQSEDSNHSKFIPMTSNSPKFSIGLGILSPSYKQKFDDEGSFQLTLESEFCSFMAFT